MKIEFKYVAQVVFIYLISITLATILFISLFWFDFLRKIDVLFFKSFALLVLSCVLLVGSLVLLKLKVIFFKLISYRDILIISLFFFTLNNMLYSFVPFNASRSVSVMIVGHLYHHQNELLPEQKISEHIYQLYFKNEDAVHRRLSEQVEIGNIEKAGDSYKLTPKGIRVVEIMGWITSAYNTEHNYAK